MKFSIIIACLNAGAFLARALNSVLAQTYRNYEIVVQDGGSSDGSLDLLNAYARRVDWRSEPDEGIYDAWNKALARASGDWVLFLGADDVLLGADVLEKSVPWLEKMPESVVFAYGGLALGKQGRPSTRIRNSLCGMYGRFFQGIGLPFPATFTRSGVLKRHAFDASFRIAGDFELTARLLNADNLARLPHYVAFMERGGVSDNPRHREKLLEERARILRAHIIPKAGLIAEACLKYLDGGADLTDEESGVLPATAPPPEPGKTSSSAI